MRRSATDWGLLVLRVGFAALMVTLHGWAGTMRVWNHFVHDQPWGKVTLVEGLGFPAPALFALLSFAAESVAAALVGLGVFTRTAAFVIAVNMAVATYSETIHGQSFELPALYLIPALALMIMGGGSFSLSRKRW